MLRRALPARRSSRLKRAAGIAVAALVLKVLASIVLEYRFYFPPDFESAFLTGREPTFRGLYPVAFYTHILAGPPTILLGLLLLWSGSRTRFPTLHHWAGRAQLLLVLVALLPSGLVMATQALAGPVAGVGFAALALATATSAVAAVYYAITGRLALHERWARRCLLLLVSPLLLRLISGALIVLQAESPTAAVLNAWGSWLVPLILYEAWWRSAQPRRSPRPQPAFAPEAL